MKKILMGLVAASCLTSFALPTFAEEPAGDKGGEKTEKKAKKAKKPKKEKKEEGAGEAK
jgi:hypothetical protein